MMTSRRRRSAALTLAAAVAGATLFFVASLRRAEDTRDGIYLASSSEQMPDGPFCCMMPKFGNDDYSSGPDECASAPASEPTVTVAMPTPVAQEGPVDEPATPASEIAAAPTPETTPVPITEEKNERRRLSVFSASARRKRAAGHLRQVEKRHAHDPHPGVTGQLEYDHPVSYEVAVAKKPQMILNSEEMEQMYETNPKEAAKYVFVSNMPSNAS